MLYLDIGHRILVSLMGGRSNYFYYLCPYLFPIWESLSFFHTYHSSLPIPLEPLAVVQSMLKPWARNPETPWGYSFRSEGHFRQRKLSN